MSLKLSVVAYSTCMRAGLSVRAHTMPLSSDTSPDWMPWVINGRSAARLMYGRAMPSSVTSAAAEPALASRRRRVMRVEMRIVMRPSILDRADHAGPT